MKKEILHLNNTSDFWIKITPTSSTNSYIIHITEGTGDNLLHEDIEKGYVDYIYYEVYDNIQQVYDNEESDGGMVLLKASYHDFLTEEIIDRVAEMLLG